MRPIQKLLLSCLLAVALARASTAYGPAQALDPRQGPNSGTPTSLTSTAATSTTSETTSTTSTSTALDTTKTTSTTTATTNTDTTTTSLPNTSNTSTTPTLTPVTPPTSSTTPAAQTSEITTTDAEGQASTLTVTFTSSGTISSTSSAPSSSTSSDSSSGGGGLSTGSIIGMSVAGGIAVIGIVAFFIWKFTRKRFSDFDDNEAIKWPELNSHSGPTESHPLPVHSTGRSGFETGSEADLSRADTASNYSTPDFAGASQDPYAVPPLPHLNPNQPYRDDPTTGSGYYDPYRGPVPGTLENGGNAGPEWGAEAIPMNQMTAGRMSPGPQVAYGGDQTYAADPMFDPGRRSPGPQAAYTGRSSPGPQAAYQGRSSPGPQAAYSGRSSPGPQAAYAGRTSPGPEAAYGGRGSPGPHAAYDTYGAR